MFWRDTPSGVLQLSTFIHASVIMAIGCSQLQFKQFRFAFVHLVPFCLNKKIISFTTNGKMTIKRKLKGTKAKKRTPNPIAFAQIASECARRVHLAIACHAASSRTPFFDSRLVFAVHQFCSVFGTKH